MELRCPFCYSNKVEKRRQIDGKAYKCRNCDNEFDDDFALYANPRRSRRKNSKNIE